MRKHLLVAALVAVALGVLALPSSRPALGNPLTQVTQITTGSAHTCALLADGGVKCWGGNGLGDLGDGTRTDRTTPTDVLGLQEGVVSVAAGGSHTCALLETGRVKCWGANLLGELGDGTITTRTAPVDVCQVYDEALAECATPLTSVTAIAAGTFHNCALTVEATVYCWGRNTYGQLGAASDDKCSFGDGPFPASGGLNPELCSTTPLEVAGLTDVVAVDAGGNNTCALTIEGRVKCWGVNSNRQLGTPTSEICLEVGVVPLDCSTTPVDVCLAYDEAASQCDEFLTATAVATGGTHSCAITVSGGATCWGSNSRGTLGDGSTPDENVFPPSSPPVDVVGLTQGVAQIAAGSRTSCAVTAEALLFCWGGNEEGQLGDGTGGRSGDRSLVPVSVCADAACATPLSNVAAVSVGFHTCALLEGSGVKCWGDNTWGQLGDGTICCGFNYNRPAPVDVVAWEAKPTPTPTMTPEVLLGDVNCDGTLTSVDAVLVLQRVARLLQTLPCLEDGDIDEDGAITALDAVLILQHSAGLITSS